mgnify:CR=1 FL=1
MNIEIRLNIPDSPAVSVIRDSGLVQVSERTIANFDRTLNLHVFNGDFTYVLKGLVDYLPVYTSLEVLANNQVVLNYSCEELQFIDYEATMGDLDVTNPNRQRNENGITEHLTFFVINPNDTDSTTNKVEGEVTSEEV